MRHDFISYHFLQHIHARDVGEGRAEGFWKGQFLICANLAAAPLWIAGLIGFLRERRYRMLALMYLVPLAMFAIGKGRDYYMAGAYPMLLAMGAVMAERWLNSLPRWGRRTIETVYFAAFALLSLLSVRHYSADRFERTTQASSLSRTTATCAKRSAGTSWCAPSPQIRDSLPAEQQAHLGITTANYGEYGAIEILGRAYGLPEPIGTTNSEWLRGYPTTAPTTLIVLGLSAEQANATLHRLPLAGHNGNSEGVRNEESQYHPDIFVCGPPRLSWAELWKQHLWFG